MIKEELIKEYSKLEKKYSFPNFEEMDKEYEIRAIDIDKVILLNALVRVVRDTSNAYISLIDTVVSPNPNWLHSMIEVNHLTEDDKSEILKMHHELMVYYHEGFKVMMQSDKEKASYVLKMFKLNQKFKKESIIHLNKLIVAWETALSSIGKETKSRYV